MEKIAHTEDDSNTALEILIALHIAQSAAERAESAAIRLTKIYDLRAAERRAGHEI